MKDLSVQKETLNFMAMVRDSGIISHQIAIALSGVIFIRWLDTDNGIKYCTEYGEVLPARLSWSTWQQLPANDVRAILSEKIPESFTQHSRSERAPLDSYINELGKELNIFSRFSDTLIMQFIEWISDKQFLSSDEVYSLRINFDAVLDAISKDKLAGIFKLPSSISRLVVELVSPSIQDKIYDPCAGMGDLLLEVNRYLTNENKEFSTPFNLNPEIKGSEKHSVPYVLAITKFLISSDIIPLIKFNDVFVNPYQFNNNGDFDLVLSNLPWGEKLKTKGLPPFPVQASDSISFYIQHSLSMLKEGGRSIFIVPGSFLFQSGNGLELRKYLIEKNTVEAVMSLPGNVFQHTSIKGYLVVIRKGGTTKKIRMVNSESYFHRNDNWLKTELVAQLVQKTWDEKASKNCWDVSVDNLLKINLDFTPVKRDTSKLDSKLSLIHKDIKSSKLKDCSSIYSGGSISKEFLDSKSTYSDAISYIRIKDIQNGKVHRGTAWLNSDAEIMLVNKPRLQFNDVLISKSGTIGKAGLVDESSVGSIASSGFYVIQCKKNKLDPKFLLAYFNSEDVRAWFKDRATGSVISHLRKNDIDDILIPLLSLDIQARFAGYYNESNLDVLSMISEHYAGEKAVPYLLGIDKIFDILPEHISETSNPLDFLLLEQLESELKKISNKATLNSTVRNKFTDWLFSLSQSLSGIKNISKVPVSPSLYSILTDVHSRIFILKESCGSSITFDGDGYSYMITDRIIKLLEITIEQILSDIKVEVNAFTETLVCDKDTNVGFMVINSGVLPLRNFIIASSPNWGTEDIGILQQDHPSILNFKGYIPNKLEPFNLTISWMAERLDGQQVKGTKQLVFDVVANLAIEDTTEIDLGGSPYVCGDPVRPDRKDVFFGREELLEQIHRYIIKSGNVVLLEGNRRAGKTSILSHLVGANTVPGWLGVYCSLQGAEGSKDGTGISTADVFIEIAISLAKSLCSLGIDVPLPNGTELLAGKKPLGIGRAVREGISHDAPFSDLREYVEVVIDLLEEQNLKLLLMLDEFDKIQEGIDSGVTSPQVPENIRYLVQTYPNFSAILTGSRRLKRLREEYWSALFGLGTRIGVSALQQKDASKLITEPVKGLLTYSKDAISTAYELTAGQPYLLQCLCNRIFDYSAQQNIRSITVDVVEHASDLLVEDNEHFASLWGYAGSDRCRYILALCQHNNAIGELLHLGVIQELLSIKGIEVNEEMLIKDLEHLRELEMVTFHESSLGGHYTLGIPLMGIWIDKQKDYAALITLARNETEDENE